ncbi:MAG: hypothetical protein ACR2MN_11195 [Acidimicrobiales bacterium]
MVLNICTATTFAAASTTGFAVEELGVVEGDGALEDGAADDGL